MLQASVSSFNSSRLSLVSEPTNIAFSSLSSITSFVFIKFSINFILSNIFTDIIASSGRLLFSSYSNLLLYKVSIPKVSLVGYTNAGKSTLRNALCDLAAKKENKTKEKVFEADMLFATLDTTTRAITLKNKGVITLTDTVGFVRKLPHDLVEAFKSTLEEVIFSDLLCHVIDTSSDTAVEQYIAVNEVLTELGAIDKETIIVLNKMDKASEEQINKIKEALEGNNKIIEVSAAFGTNLEEFLEVIEEKLPYNYRKVEYLIPYEKGDIQSFLHRNGRVFEEDYRDNGTYMCVEVDDEVYNKTEEYIIK